MEIIEDGESVSKGGIGSAAAGGLLFGGAGAVVGSVTGKKQKAMVNRISVRVNFNNRWIQTEEIVLLSTQTARNSFMYRATIDNAKNNYATSTLYEKDAKYLRLKTLQVAYNFHFPLMKKLGLNTCQLAFAGYNLWTITPYLWGDPEARATNAPSYPLSKTYTLSLKLGF